MIEMLGVLAIIGVLSVGGIAGYTKAMAKYKVNKTIDQITQIAMNIKVLFANQGNYSSIPQNHDNSILRKTKSVPEEMWDKTGNGFHNAWGKYVSIHAGGPGGDGDNSFFAITLEGIPVDACIELLTKDWKTTDISAIEVGYYSSVALSTPTSVADATNICSEAYQLYSSTSKISFLVDFDKYANKEQYLTSHSAFN